LSPPQDYVLEEIIADLREAKLVVSENRKIAELVNALSLSEVTSTIVGDRSTGCRMPACDTGQVESGVGGGVLYVSSRGWQYVPVNYAA
jgi:hypothetical protein